MGKCRVGSSQMCQCPLMILALKMEKWENQGQSPSLRCKTNSIAVFLLICFQLSEQAAPQQ